MPVSKANRIAGGMRGGIVVSAKSWEFALCGSILGWLRGTKCRENALHIVPQGR
jgi:hypothetical protein